MTRVRERGGEGGRERDRVILLCNNRKLLGACRVWIWTRAQLLNVIKACVHLSHLQSTRLLLIFPLSFLFLFSHFLSVLFIHLECDFFLPIQLITVNEINDKWLFQNKYIYPTCCFHAHVVNRIQIHCSFICHWSLFCICTCVLLASIKTSTNCSTTTKTRSSCVFYYLKFHLI